VADSTGVKAGISLSSGAIKLKCNWASMQLSSSAISSGVIYLKSSAIEICPKRQLTDLTGVKANQLSFELSSEPAQLSSS
jgi:hypothetical protein